PLTLLCPLGEIVAGLPAPEVAGGGEQRDGLGGVLGDALPAARIHVAEAVTRLARLLVAGLLEILDRLGLALGHAVVATTERLAGREAVARAPLLLAR